MKFPRKMNTNELKTRGRLLTTPKLHRRFHVTKQEAPASSVKLHLHSSSDKAEAKYKCPPIDNSKDLKVSETGDNTAPRDSDSPPKPGRANSRKDPDVAQTGTYSGAPLSPANGISAACAAMANACSHDHDYFLISPAEAARIIRHNETLHSPPLAPQIISHKKLDAKTILSPKPVRPEVECPVELTPNPQRPAPAPPMLPKSPREAKPTRVAGSKLRRRYVRPEQCGDDRVPQATSRTGRGKSGKGEDFDPTCVFTGTRKMSESKPAKPLRRQKVNPETRLKSESSSESLISESQQSGPQTLMSKSQLVTLQHDGQAIVSADRPRKDDGRAAFDVSKDELTAAWLSMVNNLRHQINPAECDYPSSAATEDVMPRHSTPVRETYDVASPSDLCLNFDISLDSPRSDVMPRSPSPSKRTAHSTDSETHLALNDSTASHDDSAYSSLASSIATRPPTSGGLPTFRDDSRPGSRARPLSSGRPASAGRPPSGGKRVAACSLSSSSSSTCATSSDEDESECGSVTSSKADVAKGEKGVAVEATKRAGSSRSSSGKSQQRNHRLVKTKNGKKFLRQRDATDSSKKGVQTKAPVVPAPPKKPHPKRDPLPMRLRALPPSFWQEPNKLNPSPYCVLPPVQPLFRQGPQDDIADIRPVTPQEDDKSITLELGGHGGSLSPRHDGRPGKTVIHTGDPDLLLRLFDPVEPQNRFTGTRVKRGRPKRQPRVMPPPRLKLDNNPCIMESITQKLFPKLTLERRGYRSESTRTTPCPSLMVAHSSGDVVSAKLALAPELDHLVCFNTNVNNNSSASVDAALKDQSSASLGILSLSGSIKAALLDDDVIDHGEIPMDVMSVSHVTPRPDVFALPPVTQDYSQMLTEVAAFL